MVGKQCGKAPSYTPTYSQISVTVGAFDGTTHMAFHTKGEAVTRLEDTFDFIMLPLTSIIS